MDEQGMENTTRMQARRELELSNFDEIPNWPQSLNTKIWEDRKKPQDENSLSKLPKESSSDPPSRADNYGIDHFARAVGAVFDAGPDLVLEMKAEAWKALRNSVVSFRDEPVGTVAAAVENSEDKLNYDQEIT